MIRLFWVIFMWTFVVVDSSADSIDDYTPIHQCVEINGTDYTLIRSFRSEKRLQYIAVDNSRLKTTLLSEINSTAIPCSEQNSSRYDELVELASSEPYPLQNDGMTHKASGMTITVDFCPSSKDSFERGLFEEMIERLPHPVPVTLFVTGAWIDKHSESFSQLLQWDMEKKLAITWGNHTYHHPYRPKAPLEQNFSLIDGYDLREDTLALEKLLLSRGIVPSLFFRFPGLVSDVAHVDIIRSLGLVIIGSDTWIAKGQKPHSGSIILLHGNRSEHIGVEMFVEMLHSGVVSEVDMILEI